MIADPDALSVKPFYGRVMTGAVRALGDSGVGLRLRLVATPPVIDDEPPFGRILVNMPAEAAAPSRRTRTVALGRCAAGIAYIAPDNQGGARQAAVHLISSGRRQIGAVFGPQTPCALERKTGFLAAAAVAGQSVVSIDGDFTRATAYAAARQLLTDHPQLDAIFAACDVTAIGVLQALRETGRRVPHDVAVVGFDGSALAEAPTCPRSTCPSKKRRRPRFASYSIPRYRRSGRLPTVLTVRGSS